MPRPRLHDRDAAVAAAMRVFWTHGYSKAPLSELTAATGMGKGSLYNMFGSKAGLFSATVEAYQARFSAPILAALGAEDVYDAVDGAIAAHIGQIVGDDTPSGCLIAFGGIDAPSDDDAAGRIRAALKGLETTLTARFARAQADGQIAPDADPAALGGTVAALIQGMAMTARRAPDDRAALEAIRETAVTLLRSAAAKR